MIIYVEGPRHSGKTYLINEFIKTCKNPNVEYYKFYFGNHIRALGLDQTESSEILHYFSLGNIMTIMEMNLQMQYSNKIWIFDRAIISAYVWAELRSRLNSETATSEYLKLIQSDLFKNSKTILIKVNNQTDDSQRKKDYWDGLHSTIEELQLMDLYITIGDSSLNDTSIGNETFTMINNFDEQSIHQFNSICNYILKENTTIWPDYLN